MLPFLKKKHQTGVITQTRQPDEDKEPKDSEDQGLMACAQDLIDAIQASDSKRVAAALRAAFEIVDSQPHEEGEHTDEEAPFPHSYDAQNIKAAK
jgi:hypothetical protein